MRLVEIKTRKSFYSQTEIGSIIRRMIDKRETDAWEINNGWCGGFAMGLSKFLGPEAKVVNSHHDFKDGTFPGHYWVEYRGNHFDAETPDGVMDPKDMQYHKRLRAIADSDDDVSEAEAVRQALGHDPIYYGEK